MNYFEILGSRDFGISKSQIPKSQNQKSVIEISIVSCCSNTVLKEQNFTCVPA